MCSKKKSGILYLVPTAIDSGGEQTLSPQSLEAVRSCNFYLLESRKVGIRHIKAMVPSKDLQSCQIEVLNKHTRPEDYPNLLEPLINGDDICLISDSGCPNVADPGAPLILAAHSQKISIRPLAGPSSVLLALMASGLTGQRFTFHGYLSPNTTELRRDLKGLEREARRGYTQIFMETPYRSGKVANAVLKLSNDTLFCIAANLTGDDEYIKTMTVENWRKEKIPDLQGQPCIFLLG